MPVSKNSKNSRRSKGVSDSAVPVALCFFASAAVMAAAIFYFYRTGRTLAFGDAEAHLAIARRIVDSRTPGWSQIGTTWLPLPHLLMIPLVRNDFLWTTGLAGAIPSGACMAVAATFLFAAVRRLLASTSGAVAAVAVFLLNPNTLYLGSTPMTEPVFFAALAGLLYFTVRFRETQGWGALAGASLAALAGTLTRYEAWMLLPFAALYICLAGGHKRWAAALLFCAIAGAGPLLWLAHNRYYFGDPLYFYRGPYSALAIQGQSGYPGKGDWRVAARYFFAAGQAIAGWPALAIGAAGLVVAIARRAIWPIVFLALPPVFYIWSIHSGGTPVYVPTLWPQSWYNTRYAMAFLPLIAVGAGALAQFKKSVAIALVVIALGPFLIHPVASTITWQEADVNSRARRQWTAKAVAYLRGAAGPHQTYFTRFGDLTPIYRTLGVPLKNTLTGDNDLEWNRAVARPDLFLNTDWAVVTGGDEPQSVLDKARLHGPRYELEQRVVVKGEPVMEIYRRSNENPVH
jgi:hypothetical protein